MYKRYLLVLAASTIAYVPIANAACTTLEDCIREKYPELKKSEMSKIREIIASVAKTNRETVRAQSKGSGAPLVHDKAVREGTPSTKATNGGDGYDTSLNFYLRQNFEDISLFSQPKDTSDANGAELSWTRDRVAKDTTWTADGTAAVSYSIVPKYLLSTDFRGLAIAAYAGATREVHTKNTSSDVDVKQFGMSGEVGWYSSALNGSNYFRGTGSFKEDDIKGSSVANGKVEYLPVWLWDVMHSFIPLGPATLVYNVRPEVLAQYDYVADGNKTILFSGQRDAFRVGPEAVLWMKLSAPSSPIANLLQQTFLTFTYHWWTEAYSGRTNSWLDASLVHNLDSAGNIALKLAYRRGRNEDTGANTDLFKISLSAKMCVDAVNNLMC
jgi:hypothetical protein